MLHLLFTHPPPVFVRLLSHLPHLRLLQDRGHGIMLHLLTNFLLFYAGAIMALSLLGRFFKQGRFYARILSYYFLLMTCTAYGVVASVALRAVGKVSIAQWTTARAFKNVACPLIGIEFEVENEQWLQTRPAVFVSNHQTWGPPLLLLLCVADRPGEIENSISSSLADSSPSTAVSPQRALSNISPSSAGSVRLTSPPPPLVCWYRINRRKIVALSGTVFIDRTNRKSAIAAFDGAICEIRDNKQSVWIFPEGTRSHFPAADLLPFKKGAFHLAIQAGVPIVPVVVANYSHVLHLRDRTFEQGLIKIKVCLHSEPEQQQANMAGKRYYNR